MPNALGIRTTDPCSASIVIFTGYDAPITIAAGLMSSPAETRSQRTSSHMVPWAKRPRRSAQTNPSGTTRALSGSAPAPTSVRSARRSNPR